MSDPRQAMDDIVVNGKVYPLWQQFVQRKQEWIGGTLREQGDSGIMSCAGPEDGATEILDIELRPNGTDSATFHVIGKDFTCGSDIGCLGIIGRHGFPEGFLVFSGYGGHTWGIRRKL